VAFRWQAKSHSCFSQEFLIHSHADIGFCLVLCVLVSLMFEVSGSPLPLLNPQSPQCHTNKKPQSNITTAPG
uniref:Uncharacterized protein n=1 Tax=Anolis carolinensis TaxID=28377 RepID=A0A803T1Y7_ANOCA